MEMIREPFWSYSSFFAVQPQPLNQYPVPATKKSMKRKNPEVEFEREQEESVDSTELTISWGFSSTTKKPRTSETSSTISCGFSSTTKKPRTSETSSTATSYIEKKNHTNEEVSTELTLLDQSWFNKKRNNVGESAHNSVCTSKDSLEAEMNRITVAFMNSVMKYFDAKEEKEKSRMSVSTKLNLDEDTFKVKKKLTHSDLGSMCRLLVKTSMVKEHILPYLSTDRVNEIESDKGKGARVMVWDQDTKSVHQLIFKRWRASKSYVFIEKWIKDFVQRRNLKEGDEIGLSWDPNYSRFNFSVLKRAPRNQLTIC